MRISDWSSDVCSSDLAGEECVLHHERRHLSAAGRDDLADNVRWTSVQDGDGFGFDIRSFEADGREKLIEVKTNNGWERKPFHTSRNELAVAATKIGRASCRATEGQ